MRRGATVALAVLACTASTAEAGPVDWLPRFEAAAMQTWGAGAPPPCGRPTYLWTEDLPPTVAARTYRLACLVTFNVAWWHAANVPAKCMATVHELGHLYGREHTDHGIMARSRSEQPPWRVVGPCARTIRSLHGSYSPR